MQARSSFGRRVLLPRGVDQQMDSKGAVAVDCSRASTARCFAAPNGRSVPSALICNGPKSLNRNAP